MSGEIEGWFAQIEAAEKTRELYEIAMQKYVRYTSKTPAELLEEAEGEIMQGVLMRKRRIREYLLGFRESLKKEGFAPKSINTFMAAVKSFYKTNDIDLPNLKEKAGVPLEENGSRMQLTIEDIRKLLNHCKNLRDKALIYTIISSGLGSTEIRNLKVRHIRNIDANGIATLQLTRQKVNYEFITFLSPEAVDAIKEYLDFRNKNPKLAVKGEEDWVFVTEGGKKITEGGMVEIFRSIGRNAGYSNGMGAYNLARAHNLRKFFNSQLLNNGADIFFTDYLMGHKIDSTHEAYFKASPEKLKERYMRYLPFLTIERTEARVLESEAYNRLQAENAQLRFELEKMQRQMNEITKDSKLMMEFVEMMRREPKLLDLLKGTSNREKNKA